MLNKKLLINKTFSPPPIEEDFEMKIRWVKPSLFNEKLSSNYVQNPKIFLGGFAPQTPLYNHVVYIIIVRARRRRSSVLTMSKTFIMIVTISEESILIYPKNQSQEIIE